MENYGKPKKVAGMKFITKFMILVFFLLFSFFMYLPFRKNKKAKYASWRKY